ncbi:MAG TPA: large conductance mechanosensitive channel protein MscL [Acidisarcina sp.]
MLKGFRDFVLRGNVIDLAVAVIIGAAFGAVVTSLVTDIITPLIAAVVHKPDFAGLVFHLNGSTVTYGKFLNALIAFLLIAASVYFLFVKPINALLARFNPPAAEPAKTRPCPECLSEIPVGARRCAQCAQPVAVIA